MQWCMLEKEVRVSGENQAEGSEGKAGNIHDKGLLES